MSFVVGLSLFVVEELVGLGLVLGLLWLFVSFRLGLVGVWLIVCVSWFCGSLRS